MNHERLTWRLSRQMVDLPEFDAVYPTVRHASRQARLLGTLRGGARAADMP
jgi:hypothetical protein